MENTAQSQSVNSKSLINRFLYTVEKVGNALPHPASLFALFALSVIILSWVISLFDPQVINPATGEQIKVVNLLSVEGLHMILMNLVTNFTGFVPLGTVLVAMLGVGVAERSGLISTVLRKIVMAAPAKILTFVVVFAGVLSNTASEVGYVLLVPLAAVIFLAAGRHPLAGLAAAFAGVSGGYSANLLLGTVDPLLAGLSQEAAHIIDPNYLVNPACNFYFMFVSTFLIAGLGTWVTEKVVAPRLGEYSGEDVEAIPLTPLTKAEKKGLMYAGISVAAIFAVILAGVLPENGFLLNPENGEFLTSPFMKGIVAFIFLFFAIPGIAFGIGAGTIKNDADVMKGMGKSMETMGSYIVLVFFAAQFVAFFKWSNIGLVVAVEGATLLQTMNLGTFPLMFTFVILAAIINLVMGSASAKWAIMAPVFIPMFMMLGYSPEFTQLAYRIGDSVTNIISPMMSYFALIVAFIQLYDKKAGIGTVVSLMLPYTLAFFIGWMILFFGWILFNMPIGPASPIQI